MGLWKDIVLNWHLKYQLVLDFRLSLSMRVDTFLHNFYFCCNLIDNLAFLTLFTWNLLHLYLFSVLEVVGVAIIISEKDDFLALTNCELSLYLH